jgi:hypothetical protein
MRYAVLLVLLASVARAETGEEAWLHYSPVPGVFPSVIVKMNDAPEIDSAAKELARAIFAFSGKMPREERALTDDSIVWRRRTSLGESHHFRSLARHKMTDIA